jgi:hypothetical protein
VAIVFDGTFQEVSNQMMTSGDEQKMMPSAI